MSCEAAGPARNLKLEAEEAAGGGGRRREELRPSAICVDKTNIAPSARKGGFREEQAEGKVEGGGPTEKGRGRREEMLTVTAAALP